MKENSKVQFETKCVHSGIDEYEFGPVVPPIYQTSTFKFKSAQHGASLFAGEEKGYINTIMKKYGVETTFVDTSNLEEVKKAIKPNTKVVYVETPGNPTLCISDLTEISKITHQHNAQPVVDNTFMSPALQHPIALGADVVLHSLTKFLNGHADVVGGIVVVKDEET